MDKIPEESFPMRKAVFCRPVWLAALLIAVILLAITGLLVNTSWRSLHRLQPIHAHLHRLTRLQAANLHLQELLLKSINTEKPIDPARLGTIRSELGALATAGGYLNPDTPRQLKDAVGELADHGGSSTSSLSAVLLRLRNVLTAETHDHNVMLDAENRDTRVELETSGALLLAVPLVGALFFFLMRRRILEPLDNLGRLMNLLSRQNYHSVPGSGVNSLLKPLFDNYNHMVTRLAELEAEDWARRQSLEHQVRAATQTLLEQRSTLARAERLAAVGEVAAGLAHELRNPLAGIQIALSNLRKDLPEEGLKERVDRMIAELKNVNLLLSDLLGQAQQAPEPSRHLNLADTIADILSLLRYQVPDTICLQHDIPADLNCRLPESKLRQALLNLVLNAAQAIGAQPGAIRIHAEESGDLVLLSVLDNGPGFPEDLLATGIRAFATWRESGTGLGLAMVRRFVRDLGGDLKLSNRPEGGACATLELPNKRLHG